jgi:hypothetical protein
MLIQSWNDWKGSQPMYMPNWIDVAADGAKRVEITTLPMLRNIQVMNRVMR